jgi:tetratricopeptide (TPR) repeat protein
MLAAMLACGSAATPAFAQDGGSIEPAPSQEVPVETWTLDQLVSQLVQQGNPDEAQRLLEAAIEAAPDNQQPRFLLGMLAMAEKDYRRAVGIFRGILIDHPDAVRVRLELARAYYLNGDYQNADRQFRAVRAGDLPAPVLANVDGFLFQIRQAKEWSYSFSIALAPDTNINGATTERELELFGLPFTLSEDARKKSGIGANVEGSLEFAPHIAPNARWRIGGAVQRREYDGDMFDDMVVSMQTGPRVVLPHWDLSILATGMNRWYGGDLYSQARGGRIEAMWHPGGRSVFSASLGLLDLDYTKMDDRDGLVLSASLAGFRQLDATSALTARVGINRQDAREPAYANWSGLFAAGYQRELPAGFSIYLEPSIGFADYDAALVAFDRARSDRVYSGTLALLNRHIVFDRFTPRVAYTFTRTDSNIDLYDFNRHRIEIGLTTVF